MKTIKFGRSEISGDGPCYVIAEIGHNHQGNLKVALDMIQAAADCGVDAVKFQKRDNKALYNKAMYNKPYDNENSFGLTYGEHREFLEFGWDDYVALKKLAEEKNVEFMCTAFDFNSVDFLEKLGITSYKVASGDVTNIPLLEYIAATGRPIFLSTGASTLDETHLAYEAIRKHHDDVCLLHAVCSYPAQYCDLNMHAIETLRTEFPDAIIGYSGHDNGILAASVAYMLGAKVVEKHFTLNHAWKGTDHKFSLEREGMRKQVRDLRRIDDCLGDGVKRVQDCEIQAKQKMGKALYAHRDLPVGHVLSMDDIEIKSPGYGLPPYRIESIMGKKLRVPLPQETSISLDDLESV
jgi:N-acetylneuraminate synthase/sialic acid synthase